MRMSTQYLEADAFSDDILEIINYVYRKELSKMELGVDEVMSITHYMLHRIIPNTMGGEISIRVLENILIDLKPTQAFEIAYKTDLGFYNLVALLRLEKKKELSNNLFILSDAMIRHLPKTEMFQVYYMEEFSEILDITIDGLLRVTDDSQLRLFSKGFSPLRPESNLFKVLDTAMYSLSEDIQKEDDFDDDFDDVLNTHDMDDMSMVFNSNQRMNSDEDESLGDQLSMFLDSVEDGDY